MQTETRKNLIMFCLIPSYNFPSKDFTCEDDHVACMGILYNFIQDHAQIPITHISSEMFHTQQK